MKIYSVIELAKEYLRNYNNTQQNLRFKEHKQMSKQAKTLDKQDLRRLLDCISTRKHSLRNKTILFFMYYTGVRVGECASLKVGDVLTEEGKIKREIVLKKENTKTNDARTIYVNEKLLKQLNEYINGSDLGEMDQAFFSTQKSKCGFSANSLTVYFHHLFKEAGVYGGSSHSCRRTFITDLANKGVNARVLMALSGHKNMTVLQRYIDVNDDIKRRTVELL